VSGGHALALTGVACDPRSAVRGLDPRAKLIGLLAVTLVAVSTPLAAWPVYAGCAAVLGAYAVAARVSARVAWRRWRVVLPLVLAAGVLLPFARPGGAAYALGPVTLHEEGLRAFAAVAAKAGIGTLSAVLLGATATFPEVLRGMAALRVPRLLVLIAAFMYRYLFVMVEEAIFLRTHARGERVYLAMLARGYRGSVPQLVGLRLTRSDVAFVVLVLAALVPLRVAA
jgi:cobalt/nickel transport system permease protein